MTEIEPRSLIDVVVLKEEMVALTKYFEKRNLSTGSVIFLMKDMIAFLEQQEVADVEIMIEQIKLSTDWQRLVEKVETAKHDKLLRLKNMLKEKP